jgi:poly-beta-1,6-N-acetyl-D-glucosamine N-deacetylase
MASRGRGRLAAALAVAVLVHAPAAGAAPAAGPAFPLIAILCYHDVSADSTAPLQTVPPAFLREQIRACKADGWTFLSLAELLAQRDHPERLPPRVLVLTFDDGCRSFAKEALPVLHAEGVRATLAIVTSFVEQSPAAMPPLLTWPEIRDLDRGGDVEIASHSHAQHDYEVSNPYHDTAPAVATRRYLPDKKRYEDREEYRSRVGDDLAETQRVLRDQLGHAAAVLAWPYGMHNEMARGLAAHAGFSATLAMGGRPVSAEDLRSGCLPRIMVTRRMSFVPGSRGWLTPPVAPVRAAQVDLDALWDPDEAAFRARLDQAVSRVRALGATYVILPACSDSRRDGRLLRAYAMNHELPVLADVWSMAAAKFAAARLRVWVRAPAMNLTWAWERHPDWRIQGGERGATANPWGTRLSPDLPEVRRAAVDFFTDLAVYLPIDGVLFDDDAMMRPGERLSLAARADARAKSVAIRELIEACKQAVRAWRPECRFARAIPAEVVMRSGVDPRFALDYAECLASDDFTVVMAGAATHPGRPPSVREVERLARRAVARWNADPRSAHASVPPPVLLMLPAYDLAAQRWIATDAQQAMAGAALRAGVFHLGSFPIAAEGELPAGLLDDRTRSFPGSTTSRR